MLAKTDTSFPLFLFPLPKKTRVDEFCVFSNNHQLRAAFFSFVSFIFFFQLGNIVPSSERGTAKYQKPSGPHFITASRAIQHI